MKRRRYETFEDRKREDWVMGKIAKALGLRWKRQGKMSIIDGELADCTNGIRVIAIIEIKCRYNDKAKFPELIVAKKKIDSGVKLAEKRGLEYILGVRWMDAIAYMRISSTRAKEFGLQMAGRTDRNDKADIEECYMIPVQGFTDIPYTNATP